MNDEEIIKNAFRKVTGLSSCTTLSYENVFLPVSEEIIKETRAEVIGQVLDIINREFPVCTCKDDIVNPDCPNELLDGAWSNNLNLHLSEEIKALLYENNQRNVLKSSPQKEDNQDSLQYASQNENGSNVAKAKGDSLADTNNQEGKA